MPRIIFCYLFALWNPCFNAYSQNSEPGLLTLAFYNVENLFDTLDNPDTWDEDFTPEGRFRYSSSDYKDKLKNISLVISGIGSPRDRDGPELIGLAEVENLEVLKALLQISPLSEKGYQIIHEDSQDPRGIDVALLYKDSFFLPLSHAYHKVGLWDEDGEPIRTRDVLHVHGLLMGEEIHLLVNHWPSKRRGARNSAPRRKKAAYVNRQVISGIRKTDQNARIVIMGDFNDDPLDESIRKGLLGRDEQTGDPSGLYNPMEIMYQKGWNSMAYRDRLHLFDQILCSRSIMDPDRSEWSFFNSGIYKPKLLITSTGKYRGYPKRGFSNGRYNGGFSDHYPVYLQLSRN